MNNCKECNYKDNYFNTGHCYMFKNEPRHCGQFRAKPFAKTYQPRVPDEPRTHSDGGGTSSSHSWVNAVDSLYSTSSSDSTSSSESYSSGGGDSGGGGSSGDW